jgi:Mn-dependent DtxR family transcriptional regulator
VTGSDIQRLLDYLASDQLGYQYTANVARFAHVQPDDAAAALDRLQEGGLVDSMGDGDRRGWKITKLGLERMN